MTTAVQTSLRYSISFLNATTVDSDGTFSIVSSYKHYDWIHEGQFY